VEISPRAPAEQQSGGKAEREHDPEIDEQLSARVMVLLWAEYAGVRALKSPTATQVAELLHSNPCVLTISGHGKNLWCPRLVPARARRRFAVRAAGLNRGELLRHGLTKPGPAKIGGTEGAGEVDGSGARVMGRLPASFAEYALMDESDAIPVPPSLSWEEEAAIPITFLVVYDMLVQQGALMKNEWLLVTGASAGVGVAALLAGKALGAKVIGTSGSEDKLKKLSALGLDVAIPTRNPISERSRGYGR
jgi:hypothetical protein